MQPINDMKTILVVGVGALGSHVVQFCRSLDASIRIIDFDRVEQKNLLSQFHSKPHVGRAKVESIKQTMHFLFGSKIEVIPHKLASANDDQLLGNADLIIDCLDNGAARRLVQSYARRSHVPCVHGALAADGTFGQVIWDEQFVIDDESGAGAATCENGEHLPFIAMTSAYLAQAIQLFLKSGKKIGFQVHPTGAIRV